MQRKISGQVPASSFTMPQTSFPSDFARHTDTTIVPLQLAATELLKKDSNIATQF